MSLDVKKLMEVSRKTLAHQLGMEFIEVSKERVLMRMPVDERHHQPYGILHGGVSVALAETAASVGGWYQVEAQGLLVVGLEINANHIRQVRSGWLHAEGLPIHLGRRTQVWEVRIQNEQNQLVCISRCTLAVIDPKTAISHL